MNEEKILKSIKEDILLLFQLILEDDRYGTNIKVGFNTLKDSNLHNEARVENNNWVFSLYYNYYLEYIETGRKPYVTKVPIYALIDWCKRKGIPSDNKTVYAIQQSIYLNGIPARPLFEPYMIELEKMWEEWADRIFETLITQIKNYFNK